MSDSIQERYLVGYALAAKKQNSFIQPSLIEHSRQRGIDLVKLDPTKPLLEQGKLDCIIHKLYDVYWKENLHEFRQKCPGVPVIDLPEAIERLHNRVSMLEVITQLRFPVSDSERFGVPEQVVVMDSSVLSGGGALGELKFPVIAKPLDADGSAKSHKMFLIYDQEGMKILKAPIVLQEFVNHGGVIFKVYVVGDHVKCVKRRSLPDISDEKIGTSKGSLPFSQIENEELSQLRFKLCPRVLKEQQFWRIYFKLVRKQYCDSVNGGQHKAGELSAAELDMKLRDDLERLKKISSKVLIFNMPLSVSVCSYCCCVTAKVFENLTTSIMCMLCASEISLQKGNITECIGHAQKVSSLSLPHSYLFFGHLQLCRAYAAKGSTRNIQEEYRACMELKTDSNIGWICLKLP